MPIQIDRVDTEIEILRKDAGQTDTSSATGGESETLAAVRGRAELRERLRPIVMDILNDELMRIRRRVGSP